MKATGKLDHVFPFHTKIADNIIYICQKKKNVSKLLHNKRLEGKKGRSI